MANEENKPETAADATAPKEEPSPTVSHTEPAVVHSGADTPPLAGDKGHDSHGHDDHAHGGHDDHAHSAAGADFGEVIPEKNWQDSLLAGIAFLVLCGFLYVGAVWAKVEPPPEHDPGATAHEEHQAPVQELHLAPPTGHVPEDTENARTPAAH